MLQKTMLKEWASCRGPETRRVLRSFPMIMDYADKIHRHYFPDYEHWE